MNDIRNPYLESSSIEGYWALWGIERGFKASRPHFAGTLDVEGSSSSRCFLQHFGAQARAL